MMHPVPLVPVWVIQCIRSGNFLTRELDLNPSLRFAGRLYSEQAARDTAISQFSYEYEIHHFWETE